MGTLHCVYIDARDNRAKSLPFSKSSNLLHDIRRGAHPTKLDTNYRQPWTQARNLVNTINKTLRWELRVDRKDNLRIVPVYGCKMVQIVTEDFPRYHDELVDSFSTYAQAFQAMKELKDN